MTAFLQDGRWDDVRVFLAAHRTGTLGGAARKLGLDVSTMSRRLTAFEEALGIRVFERSREGLVPLRGAEQVLAAAEAMEAAFARLRRDASDVETAAEGTVRLSVAPGMADHFVAPLLPKLRQKFPRLALELDASARSLDLQRHEADLALRSVAPKGASLVVTKLGSGRWVAVGAPALVKKLGVLSSWEAAPWIAWDRDLASLPAAQWLNEHAPAAEIALRTSQFTTQVLAAQAGLGLVLVPEPYLPGRALVPVPVGPRLRSSAQSWPVDHLWLVGHRALREVPRVAAVWNFFAEEMRAALAPGRQARDA